MELRLYKQVTEELQGMRYAVYDFTPDTCTLAYTVYCMCVKYGGVNMKYSVSV